MVRLEKLDVCGLHCFDFLTVTTFGKNRRDGRRVGRQALEGPPVQRRPVGGRLRPLGRLPRPGAGLLRRSHPLEQVPAGSNLRPSLPSSSLWFLLHLMHH